LRFRSSIDSGTEFSPQLSAKNEHDEESLRGTVSEETIAGCLMHAKTPVPSERMEESGEKKESKFISMHR
jgi:hypothetical protein